MQCEAEEELNMVDKKIIEAFYMMWDSFPGPARLIHKNRTILAAKEKSDIGFL
ncbi:hypothetical protein CLHOM_14780 [Clostridium homopropionicum DSM 5847]|uniref:Uncharacterized protein n=1 Tax=Clostridium homopropionicum DSM 5847 TaxID=1121318 RepID=A0A0L6ZBC2_9CLOT|nr:hypothetical protein CLHOM_14780 [Clostridium homopropionicum DSM 5847]SFG98922.1 hypothetical protein SAMN04488501_13111 [Clostridium homopropionicum]